MTITLNIVDNSIWVNSDDSINMSHLMADGSVITTPSAQVTGAIQNTAYITDFAFYI